MDYIRELETNLAEARAEVETHGSAWESANAAATQAGLERSRHRQAAQESKLFGRIQTPRSRRHERLAEQANTERIRHDRQARELAPASHAAHDRARMAERRLAEARELADPEVAELHREQDLQALAAQRVHDRVEAGDLSSEEAYHPEGGIRWAAHDRELQALDPGYAEAREDLWGPYPDASDNGEDDGYAQAAADARADQLEVMYLDRSIDAGTRTYEEVYTPEGHIRQHLLSGEEAEQAAPAQPQEPEPAREREPRGFDIEDPF